MHKRLKRSTVRFRHGFSLIELLITLSIVAILVGLLGASVAKAKAKAQDAGCKHNNSQFGVALAAFVQDRGTYPIMVNHHLGKNDQPSNWIRALFPHPPPVQNGELGGIFDCPAAARPKNFPRTLSYAEYGYNSVGLLGGPFDDILGLGGHGSINDTWGTPVRESDVKKPDHMLAIGDGFAGWNDLIADGRGPGRIRAMVDPYGGTRRAPRRHNGKANFVFCDGHVGSPTLWTLFSDKSEASLSLWTRDGVAHTERLQ